MNKNIDFSTVDPIGKVFVYSIFHAPCHPIMGDVGFEPGISSLPRVNLLAAIHTSNTSFCNSLLSLPVLLRFQIL